MFGDRSVVTRRDSYTSSELYSYLESVLKALQKNQLKNSKSLKNNNYGWLSSGSKPKAGDICNDIEEHRSIIYKLSAENCASVAIEIDKVLDEKYNITPTELIYELKNLLNNHYNSQMINQNLTDMRRRNSIPLIKLNKVKPILSPPGREATVSFILD